MLLLDTHILLAAAAADRAELERLADEQIYVSVASIWEIAIKARTGKLDIAFPAEDFEQEVEELGYTLLPITASHAVAEVDPWPDTNDPFDRLLLAVCKVEGLRLVTRDRRLVDHPLAWRPQSA